MFGLGKLAVVAGLLLPAVLGAAVPASLAGEVEKRDGGYWMGSIKRQGTVAFGDANFKIFRNVMDYGAKGDGSTDDTAAINQAISDGSRCGQGCDSTTLTPAIVYFPAGTYVISSPLTQYYYTAMIGDPTAMPTLKASSGFTGMAVIDADPYAAGGVNWFTNQNNFFRQIRNFNIDLTAMPSSAGAGIHWQVAQATSLQNIVFNMVQGGSGNKQVGIFMDNGSGGFMTDLVFNGGEYGAFFGNQQFTTRNLTFNNCQTAVFMNWNWLWTLKGLNINNCGTGVSMSNTATVGSVVFQDSVLKNTPTGVVTGFQSGSSFSNGSLIIDNVDFSGSTTAVADASGNSVLAGGSKVASWGQGHGYSTSGTLQGSNNGTNSTMHRRSANGMVGLDGALTAPSKPASLLDGNGNFFERSKPQYEDVPASSFVSVKDNGAQGDGSTDDTAAIQKVLDSATSDQVVYFDHGAYRLTDTVKVPKNIRIVGEFFSIIMADGPSFNDQTNPKPVFQVGQSGDSGSVEISDLIFETLGPAPGAIMIEWNVAESSQGSAGMWDVHARIGGSAGTKLQSDTCAKNPSATGNANPSCIGAFMLLHITKSASAYLENNWFWTADHELDLSDHNQVSIYNGRGVYIESQGPVWLYGTSAEHSQLYNYQLSGAQNIYMGAIQTETPYMQSNPDALQPFTPNSAYNDPDFSSCTTESCKKSWGLRVLDSSNVFIYGAGLYSFFDNYAQTCLADSSCQDNIADFEGCSGDNYLYALTTIGTTNMITSNGATVAAYGDNDDVFGSSVAMFECT